MNIIHDIHNINMLPCNPEPAAAPLHMRQE